MNNAQYKMLIKQEENEVWSWIYENLDKLITTVGLSKSSGIEREDMIQDTVIYIYKYGQEKGINLAKKMFKDNNIGLLLSILRKNIDLKNGMQFFDTNSDFIRYKKIHSICVKYGIKEDYKNAYLISAMIGEKVFSIALIESILLKKKPKIISFDTYDYSAQYNDPNLIV